MTVRSITRPPTPRHPRFPPSFYDYLLGQPSADTSRERAQALVRIVIAFCVTAGMLSYQSIAGFFEPAAVFATQVILPVYLLLSLLLLLNIVRHPGDFAWRHYLAILFDHGVISLGMFTLGPLGTQFYPLYLWVTIGNGLRFGIFYLHLATLISALGFVCAILFNPTWLEQPSLTLGLLGGMVIIPIFFTTLLRQLRASNEQLERKIEESRHQATHDCLTGLPNRVLIEDRLNHAISKASRVGASLALLFIDSDNFKGVNDTFGHSAGDQLLRQLSVRLAAVLREDDTLARLGGDEFIVLLEGNPRPYDVAQFTERLLEAASGYYRINQQEVFVTVSIGIALFPEDGGTPEALMRNADTAMYRSKEGGGNNYRVYDAAMSRRLSEQLALAVELRRALVEQQFLVYFQPIVDAATGELVAAEALLRWEHPQHGILSPAKFIPLIENSEMVFPVGLWVMEQACQELCAWQRSGFPDICVAVNVSGRQFSDPKLPEKIGAILTRTMVAPEHLRLELTEGVLIEDNDQVKAQFRRLRKMGIVLSLDDFGTGYSSLSYLKRFPIGVLKIDKSFVQDIPQDPDSCALASSILAIGRNLGMKVVAEGVETGEQARWMRRAGCDFLQGFLFSRPLPAATFARWYRRTRVSGRSA